MTPSPSNHVHTVSCTTPHCRLPVARVIGGAFVFIAKHHGEKHIISLSLADLLELIGANNDTNLLTPREKSSILAAEDRAVISS